MHNNNNTEIYNHVIHYRRDNLDERHPPHLALIIILNVSEQSNRFFSVDRFWLFLENVLIIFRKSCAYYNKFHKTYISGEHDALMQKITI